MFGDLVNTRCTKETTLSRGLFEARVKKNCSVTLDDYFSSYL